MVLTLDPLDKWIYSASLVVSVTLVNLSVISCEIFKGGLDYD